MRKIIILMSVCLLIVIFTGQILALEAGGEYEIMVNSTWYNDSFESEIMDILNIDLFLPEVANNEFQYSFRVTNPLLDLLEDKDAAYFTKKLYLRHRFDDFNLTVGRQPVSWSFGSLLNPVDYTLGSVAMGEEYNSKYTDALEAYIPINWNSGLTLVSSYPGGFSTDFNEMKLGIRGRFGIKGYDLTLSYVQEPVSYRNLFIPKERVGLTIKGDLRDAGVYAAVSHYFDDRLASSNSYLLGIDYSYNLDYYTKLNMQLEYLGLDNSNLSPVLGPFLVMNSGGERLDLLNGSITYPIDDFSSISLMTMLNLDGSSLSISPVYQNTLPGNIDLNISGQLFLSDEDRSTSLGLGMSYPF